MGTGIRQARRELDDAGMAEPRFYDNGVSFTVRFPNSALIPDGDLTWLGGLGSTLGLNQNQKKAHRLTPADRDSTRGRRETMWLKGRGN